MAVTIQPWLASHRTALFRLEDRISFLLNFLCLGSYGLDDWATTVRLPGQIFGT